MTRRERIGEFTFIAMGVIVSAAIVCAIGRMLWLTIIEPMMK